MIRSYQEKTLKFDKKFSSLNPTSSYFQVLFSLDWPFILNKVFAHDVVETQSEKNGKEFNCNRHSLKPYDKTLHKDHKEDIQFFEPINMDN